MSSETAQYLTPARATDRSGTTETSLCVHNTNTGSQTDRCIDQERDAVQFGSENLAWKKLAKRVDNETILVGDCHNRTQLIKRIGGGSFGEIYLGRQIETNMEVAVKVETQNVVVQYVLNEGNVYRKLEGFPGIPRAHWYGLHGNEYAMMVMDLLGATLYELWVDCGSKFSMKTMLMLIDQTINMMQHTHRNNYVHRDISVSNLMVGTGEARTQIHLIDFGHAKKIGAGRFVPAATRKRVVGLPKPMVGTPRFASVFCHMGHEEGYRDDLESLGYVWIYLLKGKLPWQGQRLCPGESKLDRIAYLKLNTRLETLCDGIPEEFLVYMNYVRRLKSAQMPDHDQIRELFRNLGGALKIEYDWKFDWCVKEDGVMVNGVGQEK
jgi:serine/threonine protein kinase